MIASIRSSYATALAYRANAGRVTASIFGEAMGASSGADQTATSAQAIEKAASPSSGTGNGTRPDFTSMTRQDLRDWVNDQIKSGKMTLDDSTAFVGMSGHVPVDGTAMDDGTLTTQKVNFIDLAQQGIAGAQSRGDQQEIAMLQKALTIMGGDQASGKTDDTATADSSTKLKEALDAFKHEASMTPAQRARRDVLKTMNLTEDAIKAMPPEQQKATEQKIAAEVTRRLRLGEAGKAQTGSVDATAASAALSMLSA